MSDPAWRPGPWTAESVCGLFYRIYGPNPNGGQLNIAKTMYPNDEVAMANAYLIAASPELYESLEEFANSITGAAPPRYETVSKILERAHAALAKARGESQ